MLINNVIIAINSNCHSDHYLTLSDLYLKFWTHWFPKNLEANQTPELDSTPNLTRPTRTKP